MKNVIPVIALVQLSAGALNSSDTACPAAYLEICSPYEQVDAFKCDHSCDLAAGHGL